jgi:nitroreductase
MNIIDIIKARKSSRTYNGKMLTPADKKILEDSLGENNSLSGNASCDLRIIEKVNPVKKMELNYGTIRGHNTYLLGVSEKEPRARVNYGYMMEKVVLEATGIGISTCWIGYFDETFFNEISLDNKHEIPGLVILGYSGEKQTLLEKFTRFSVGASKRKGLEELLFNYDTGSSLKMILAREYSDPLDMVRLAPSSGNTQPWRIYYDIDRSAFHFFKKPVSSRYEEKGLHDIDMGIALSHF